MCAVAVPEVRFTNVPERTQIDVGRIPLQRLKLVSGKASFFFFLIISVNFKFNILWISISIYAHIPKVIFLLVLFYYSTFSFL